MSPARTFVDRGGTFTDVVVLPSDGGLPRIRKVPSDEAVVGPLAEGQLTFGTTVATNALLERRGVPTALVVTKGFADFVHVRHMARPALFDPDACDPPPLCDTIVELAGRRDPEGVVLMPCDPHGVTVDGAPQAVAVCLLHGPPDDERAVAQALQSAHPDAHVVCGHEVDPQPGYLARIETTLVDAAITPVLREAMDRDAIPGGALAMRSDGGLVPADQLRAPDAVLSGPAGGVLAVADLARRLGYPGAVGLDMGGTSTDVCVVVGDDLPRRQGETPVAGTFLRRPMLEVETIAAGGGSILHTDGVRLQVGPRSAGADPGPQCYGRGGPPTVTDAALVAGLLDPDAFDPPLDPGAIALPGPAEGFLDVAREAMAAAVRKLAAARGVDVRPLALVSYGGAAGQHAAEVADRLGMATVLVHPFASVLSAWGQALAPRTTRRVEALWVDLDAEVDRWRAVAEVLREELQSEGEVAITLALRALGTDHAIEVPFHTQPGVLRRSWEEEHKAIHGFRRPEGPLEVAWIEGVAEKAPPPVPDLSAFDPFDLGDRVVLGPTRLDSVTTSVVVPSGWRATRRSGVVVLERVIPPARPQETARTPAGIGVWTHRLGAVAHQAGEQLARLARSVNIRERRDFSVGLFDAQGQMVAHAPHIPVHLGAMGQTVRDLLHHLPDLPTDQAWLTNAPDAGGSHLPDLTVVTALQHDGERFFIASRAHHVDVGGQTPGSMPPRSTRLSDEGFVVRRLPLLRDGRLRDDLAQHLLGARQPDVVRADLEAQLACHHTAARALSSLAAGPVLSAWFAHLLDAAAEAMARTLPRLPEGTGSSRVDGVRLRVRTSHRGDRLCLDFSGTGGPHPANRNAPAAVVRASVLYALRLAAGTALPMNEGLLRHVDLVLPPGSLLDPPPDAAVVGGNVETSQRVVDLLLSSWGLRAASQGTMNNLSLGGDGWSLYETLGGGQGASADGDGLSGRQVHMTNTRITDPEIIERRLPLRVVHFGLRRGSGGVGRHRGGDGLVRELEVLAPAEVSLLASRRTEGPPGLNGGSAGSPGLDALFQDGAWTAWDGATASLAPGDRVRVQTPGGGGFGVPDQGAVWSGNRGGGSVR